MDGLQAELRELELQASGTQQLIDHGPASGSEDEMGDGEDSDNLDIGNLSLGEDTGEELVGVSIYLSSRMPLLCFLCGCVCTVLTRP